VRRLERIWNGNPDVFLHTLEGDFCETADLLGRAERFIFIDAFAGDRPGEFVISGETCRAFTPSFHQADIGAVMRSLEVLGVAKPFPSWEVWGITILPPSELREGLSPEVEKAVDRLCEKLASDFFACA
jgi:Ni,Fe-hydrogenase maturation factor